VKEVKDMTVGELGAYICSYLEDNGIRVVLSGGACVSIYTNNKYLSEDLDFIELTSTGKKVLRDALSEIGFQREGRHFIHLETNFFLEFPPGPLSIGEEYITEVLELKQKTGVLRMLSPTDCVKDRLAAFYHWGDYQALEQAILVSRDQEIDLDNIKQWSEKEGAQERFEKFMKMLEE